MLYQVDVGKWLAEEPPFKGMFLCVPAAPTRFLMTFGPTCRRCSSYDSENIFLLPTLFLRFSAARKFARTMATDAESCPSCSLLYVHWQPIVKVVIYMPLPSRFSGFSQPLFTPHSLSIFRLSLARVVLGGWFWCWFWFCWGQLIYGTQMNFDAD